MEESHYMWILTVPVCISLISSIGIIIFYWKLITLLKYLLLVFLINVVRVLLTKLHPCSANPAPLALKKAVRATLILVILINHLSII